MSDNSVVERWNVIDSAEMAVGVEGVLYRELKKKPRPFDFDESLDSGIAFLHEASCGGAIICGTSESQGFTGTLSPLSWSTDVYIDVEPKQAGEADIYKKIVETLENYKELLEKLKREEQIEYGSAILEKAHIFFKLLADILIRQADPVARTYSRQV